MAKHDNRSPYDPKLDPERKVIGENVALFAAQEGTSRIQRVGEQFYMTCRCGGAEVDSNPNSMVSFGRKHNGH
jgi:hypothetical protein